MAADILTKIGANLLCAIEGNLNFINNTALAITILEQFGENLDCESKPINPRLLKKFIDFGCGSRYCMRDMLKFYRKRMNCKCLKKMHLEARKTQPKIGACGYCNQLTERSLLMVCSRCMVAPYCSRKCQLAASPEHREACESSFVSQQGS